MTALELDPDLFPARGQAAPTPAPAPSGLTPADLEVPDALWRAAARARRTT